MSTSKQVETPSLRGRKYSPQRGGLFDELICQSLEFFREGRSGRWIGPIQPAGYTWQCCAERLRRGVVHRDSSSTRSEFESLLPYPGSALWFLRFNKLSRGSLRAAEIEVLTPGKLA